MNYSFLKKANTQTSSNVDYSFLSSKAKKKVIPVAGDARTVSLPEHLGGGEYKTSGPGSLIKTERDQSALGPAVSGQERDHIISVALGGTSDKSNLQYLHSKNGTKFGDPERQAGKLSVEQDAIDKYLDGAISLPQARLRIATKQQEIKGLIPKQGTLANLPGGFLKIFTDIGKGIKKAGTALKEDYQSRDKTPEERDKELATRALLGLDGKLAREREAEKLKAGTSSTTVQDVADLAKASEERTQKTAEALTVPVRWTAGSLATAVVSLGLEKAKNKTGVSLEYDPKSDAEKLIIGAEKIRPLLEQEDLYGTIARGAGVPVALGAIAFFENPFLTSTGISASVKKLIKTKIEKEAGEKIVKIGLQEIADLADDAIKAEVKAGRIEKEVAEKAIKEVEQIKKEVAVIPKEPLKAQTKKPIKYIPEEKALDARKKITTERTIAEPSVPNRIKNEAIEKGLIDDLKGGIDEYDKVSFKDQARLVGEIIDENPEKAIRIALGKELPTNGALPESVFISVKNQALKNGDTDLLIRLATEEGGVAKESTILGQRIKMLDEQLEDDAFRNIKKVVDNRKAKLEKGGKKASELAKAEKSKMKTEVKKLVVKKDVWNDFVKSIEC